MNTYRKTDGLQWTLWEQLDDFVDDLARLSHIQKQMQEQISLIETTAATLGLNVTKGESKIIKINSSITLQGEVLYEVQSFTYLGSIVDTNGGTGSDVRARIGKARAAFIVLNKIWKSGEMPILPSYAFLPQVLRLCLCMH